MVGDRDFGGSLPTQPDGPTSPRQNYAHTHTYTPTHIPVKTLPSIVLRAWSANI